MVIVILSPYSLPALVYLRRKYPLRRGRSYRRENIWLTSWKRKWSRNNNFSVQLQYSLYIPNTELALHSFLQPDNPLIHCRSEVFQRNTNSMRSSFSQSSFHCRLQRKTVHHLLYFGCSSTQVFYHLFDCHSVHYTYFNGILEPKLLSCTQTIPHLNEKCVHSMHTTLKKSYSAVLHHV